MTALMYGQRQLKLKHQFIYQASMHVSYIYLLIYVYLYVYIYIYSIYSCYNATKTSNVPAHTSLNRPTMGPILNGPFREVSGLECWSISITVLHVRFVFSQIKEYIYIWESG